MKSTQRLFHLLSLPVFTLLVLGGCTKIAPLDDISLAEPEKTRFSHDRFARVLVSAVDKVGNVDYALLAAEPKDLDLYYTQIASYSPDSHPQLFTGRDDTLAYWLNAYNASVLKTVLEYYPLASVLDVRHPRVLFFLPDGAGFFFFQRLRYGGATTSLYYLENRVIRKRYQDPRIHFALNCASRGCPRLPMQPFYGERLDEQLNAATREFIAEKRNYTIDHQAKTISLSSIFKWYHHDFLNWYYAKHPEGKATILDYISLYLPPQQAAELAEVSGSYRLQFAPYDWSLNSK